jgi:hypothetical protein
MSADQPVVVPEPPLVTVVSGSPTEEEIAALIAVLSAVSGGDDGGGMPGRNGSRWAAPSSRMRPMHGHGYGAWRGSALPR